MHMRKIGKGLHCKINFFFLRNTHKREEKEKGFAKSNLIR